MAAAHGLEVSNFLQSVADQYVLPAPTAAIKRRFTLAALCSDLVESDPAPEMMAIATGVPLETLEKLKLRGSSYCLQNQLLILSGNIPPRTGQQYPGWHCGRLIQSYCPDCLAEEFYIRRHWRLAFFCCCPIHQRELFDFCPQCGIDLDFDGRLFSAPVGRIAPGFQCQQCRFDLTQAPRNPTGLTITARFLDFQRFFVAFDARQMIYTTTGMEKRVCDQLRALLHKLPGSCIWYEVQEPARASDLLISVWDSLDANLVYNTQPCIARYILFRAVHLVIERCLAHSTDPTSINLEDEVGKLAYSLPPQLQQLILHGFRLFLDKNLYQWLRAARLRGLIP